MNIETTENRLVVEGDRELEQEARREEVEARRAAALEAFDTSIENLKAALGVPEEESGHNEAYLRLMLGRAEAQRDNMMHENRYGWDKFDDWYQGRHDRHPEE